MKTPRSASDMKIVDAHEDMLRQFSDLFMNVLTKKHSYKLNLQFLNCYTTCKVSSICKVCTSFTVCCICLYRLVIQSSCMAILVAKIMRKKN